MMTDKLTRAIEQAIRDNDDGVIGFRELADAVAAALAPLIEARVREAEEQHDEVSGRLSELLCDLTGGLLSKPGYDVSTMVRAVEEHFERTVVREARAEALTDAADAWTQGAWASTPRHKDRVADRMAASQYAGDWLRDRAEEVRRG